MESNTGKYGQRDEALWMDEEKRGMGAWARCPSEGGVQPVRWPT